MNMSTDATKSAETSLTREWIDFVRYHVGRHLGGRRGLLVTAVAVLVIGGALNWSWLVAIGIAPLLIAIAPCAVMCALGLCMSRMGGQSCSSESSVADRQSRARSSPSDRDVEAPSEPVALVADGRADAPADGPFGEGEARTAARDQSETTSKTE
jgi:hypothetical protein